MKKIYITLDDCPSKDIIGKIEYLKYKNIPAILFCIGNKIKKERRHLVDAIKEGFIVGNHSYNHPYFSDIKLRECRDEIVRTDDIITEIYEIAGVEREYKLFRFPYGDKGGFGKNKYYPKYSDDGLIRKNKIQKILYQTGYRKYMWQGNIINKLVDVFNDIDCYWTFDTIDWNMKHLNDEIDVDSLYKVIQRIDQNEISDINNLRGINNKRYTDIVLMHDLEGLNNEFKVIIDKFITKGVEFK